MRQREKKICRRGKYVTETSEEDAIRECVSPSKRVHGRESLCDIKRGRKRRERRKEKKVNTHEEEAARSHEMKREECEMVSKGRGGRGGT